MNGIIFDTLQELRSEEVPHKHMLTVKLDFLMSSSTEKPE